MAKFDKAALDKLYEAILTLRSSEDCAKFFDDLCTIQELEALSQRMEVALSLKSGKSYAEVNKMTGASTATICRVGKCLNYGSGGYALVISRMNGEGKKDAE